MKKILLLVVLLAGMSSFSQKNEKFKSGVKIIDNEKIKEYKKPKSILFIFKGHTHSINYFLDLKKRIRKDFKKKMKKEFKNFKLNFNYDLNAEKPFESDLKNIPSKKYNKNDYETICYISLSYFKGWDNELIEKRKLNYNLNIELKTINLDPLITLKLNVNSYYTILTENRNSSKLIYKTIMEN
jgi:hypothetical protein|tara:strand:+ start:75 stop:626 length:552 start_codon:yes stop_codon:yes gene_type:complete